MIHFIGTLNSSDRNELALRGKSFSDTRNKEGLAALPSPGLNNLDSQDHIKSKQTDVFDPVYIVSPAKTTTTDLLKIIVDHHKGISNSIYYDPTNTDDAVKKADVEEALEVLRESGVKVFNTIEEVAEHETEKE